MKRIGGRLGLGVALPVFLLANCGAVEGPSGGAPPATSAPTGAPTWLTDFAGDEGRWDLVQKGNGSVAFGVPDPRAADNCVVTLLFPGDARLGSADRVGPGFATEIDSKQSFLYGTFRTRLKLATCKPNEEVVNGVFTYFNDGTDANRNGIPDNSEIDIEILCGTPSVVSLTAWTDYQGEPERFVKWTRSIDLATGDYSESPSDHEYGLVPKGNAPELRRPGFPDPGAFYEMGFEWHPSRLRFFLLIDGTEVTLWDLTDARYVPQRPSRWLFNVWHPRTHWFGPGADADYPAGDAEMRIDWARYWKE